MNNLELLVEGNRPLNSYTRLLSLKLLKPKALDFKAGQFLLLQVEPKTTRAYSIASPEQQKDRLELIIDTRPGGPGSRFTLNAKVDDRVWGHGPLGQFFLRPAKTPLVFAATGCGIAPFKSMVETLFNNQEARSVTLFWGMRYLKDVYLASHFQAVQSKWPNFWFRLCLSRPEKTNPYFSGHVTAGLGHFGALEKTADYYVCGNQAMVTQVTQVLKDQEVPQNQIFTESYWEKEVC